MHLFMKCTANTVLYLPLLADTYNELHNIIIIPMAVTIITDWKVVVEFLLSWLIQLNIISLVINIAPRADMCTHTNTHAHIHMHTNTLPHTHTHALTYKTKTISRNQIYMQIWCMPSLKNIPKHFKIYPDCIRLTKQWMM